MKDLKILDLFNCEVTNVDDYRGKVFQLLDGLEALDGFDQDNKEAEDDESSDEGEAVFHTHTVQVQGTVQGTAQVQVQGTEVVSTDAFVLVHW